MYGATALACTQTKSALEPTSMPLSAKPQPHAITTSVEYIGACGTNTSITDTFHFKLAALKEHASQTSHMENLEEMLREWGQRNAGLGELPAGRIAEAFKIVNTN